MSEQHETKVKGMWIPIDILEDKNLSVMEKMLYSEINSVCEKSVYICSASNSYFANFLNCSERTASACIQKLIEKGYICIVGFNGRNRYLTTSIQEGQHE